MEKSEMSLTTADSESILLTRPHKARSSVSGSVDISFIVFVSEVSEDLPEIYHLYSQTTALLDRTVEFIFVGDGLGRDQAERLSRLKALGENVKIIKFHQQFGESVALSVGFEESRGELIVTLPDYLQTDAQEIQKLISLLEDGCDLVSTWRYPRVDPLINRWQSALFNWLTRKLTQVPLHDLNSSMRAMKRSVLQNIPVYGDFYRFLPILAYHRGFRVTEVKVRHVAEKGRKGLYGIGAYVRRLIDILNLFFLTKFTKRPLRFFGLIGALLFTSGLLINAYLSLYKYIANAGLRDRPLLLLGVLLMVLGFQTLTIGLLGEIIIFTHAREIREYHIEEIL